MEDKKVINDLTNCLAQLIDQTDDIHALAQEAIEHKYVDFRGSAFQVWGRVVQRAKMEQHLPDLIDAALRFTGNNPNLTTIRNRLLAEEARPVSSTTLVVEQPPSAPLRAFDEPANKPGRQLLENSAPQSTNTQLRGSTKHSEATLPEQHSIFSILINLLHTILISKITYIIIILITTLYTVINLILINTPLLTTDQLAIFPTIMIRIEASVIFLTSVFLILCIKTSFIKRRWIVASSSVLLVGIMLVNLCFSINFRQNVQSTVSSSDSPPYTGLCDGRCAVDIDRLDGLPKSLATTELKNGHLKAACAYLALASKEDTTDAEAKIYYEDQCGGGSGNNVAPLSCPCINYIAAIALAHEQQLTEATYTMYTNPAVYNDSTIYNNGVSRSILQAVFLRQKDWNEIHRNGPTMYIFVANVGDVNNIRYAPQWQQNVAQQIITLQQTDREHHIDGVVGLPSGMDTFISQLSQIAIPMISIASLSSNDAYNYLLSVAPTTEIEMSAATHFLAQNIKKNKHGIHLGIVYYNQDNMPYRSMATAFEHDLPPDDTFIQQAYDQQPHDTDTIVEHYAKYTANNYDAIFFAGPVNDLLTFIRTLRQIDQTTPVLASNTAYQLAYSYLPPATRAPLRNLYFTAFAYHDTQDYMGPPQSSMVSEFHQTYDPQSIHAGNIYTYQLPTSDAMLAFDAMGVFTYLIGYYSIEHLPDWQDQQAFLAHNPPPTMVSGKIAFAATGNTPQTKTVLLLQINSQGTYSYLDKVS